MYYYESRLTAIRMGPWKMHFTTRENYYDNLSARAAPLLINLRSDPFESYDSVDSFGHLAQRVSWIFEPIDGDRRRAFADPGGSIRPSRAAHRSTCRISCRTFCAGRSNRWSELELKTERRGSSPGRRRAYIRCKQHSSSFSIINSMCPWMR